MALTKGPLLSFEAAASIAGVLTYSKWKGRPYARLLVTPANPKTATQISIRALMRFLATTYTPNLTTTEKNAWTALAAVDNITKMNAYTRFNQRRWTQGQFPIVAPAEPPGTAPVMGATTATAQKGQILFSQAITTPNNIWGVVATLSLTTAYTPGRANARYFAFGTASPIAFTVTGLTPATWFYRLAGFNRGGTGSAYIAEASVVVT
jgi:hypothetical protein